MQFSEKTLEILKNYSLINPSMMFRKGSVLKTVSPLKTVFSSASIAEEIPRDFAIYDMSKFLASLTLFKEPTLIFEEKYLTIYEGSQKVNFTYADPSMIVTVDATKGDIRMPSEDISFTLNSNDLQRLLKFLSVLSLPEISITGDGSKIYIKTVNSKDRTSDNFSIEVGETDKEFNIIYKSDNLKFINGDYEITLSMEGLARFTTGSVSYYIMCESNSTFA